MNGPSIVISPGGTADLPAVMRVMGDSFDPAFGEGWTQPQCAGLLPLPGVRLTLARRGEDLVGFTLARTIAGEAELLLLAVGRSTQRQGVGAQLVDNFIRSAAGAGADRLHLEVRDGNPAIHLYGGFGFVEVGRRRDYYSGSEGARFDALTLARGLDQEFRDSMPE